MKELMIRLLLRNHKLKIESTIAEIEIIKINNKYISFVNHQRFPQVKRFTNETPAEAINKILIYTIKERDIQRIDSLFNSIYIKKAS